jgi:uncharacterized membrane protein (DUF485 family)
MLIIHKNKDMFDLLKNKRLDITISVILCLILKLFLELDKLSANGLNKNLNSCPPLNYIQLFVLYTICIKYQNNFLSTKHHTKTKFDQHLQFCLMLVCLVLSYPELIFCRATDCVRNRITTFGLIININIFCKLN